jgi:prepilin-type N-terminal cleavage/methylation domain-containing protein
MLKAFRKKEGQKGFTLLELMIVIAVIGVLAAIAIPQFMSYRQRGYNTKAKAELKSYYTACQAYFVTNTANDCDLTKVSDAFTPSTDVQITTAPNQDMMGSTAYHTSGTKTYTISSSGNITP